MGARVTMPVSCGRGDNSEKYTSSSVRKNSTPQMPVPVSEAVTDVVVVVLNLLGVLGIINNPTDKDKF